MNNLSFHDLVRLRHSSRGFLPKAVPHEAIVRILQDAQQSPSNCNMQPWNVHIVSGDSKTNLSEKLISAFKNEQFSPDFNFDSSDFEGRYQERRLEQAKAYYDGLGVDRKDKAGRMQANLQNFNFYNAPHVALLFMPSFGDPVRVAGDLGIYSQTFLLSLTANGLSGVPQGALGMFAGIIREHLNLSDDYKLLFGISFGYEDKNDPNNSVLRERDPIEANVTFHSF